MVGVGFAFQKCRHCQCQYGAMQKSFYEQDFVPRTKESYDRQCREIEEAATEQQNNDLQITYGITNRSILCKMNLFDVTKQRPQDSMDSLVEGVVQYEPYTVTLHFRRAFLIGRTECCNFKSQIWLQ